MTSRIVDNFDAIVAELEQSSEQYPVDLCEAWQWLGYKKRYYAIEAIYAMKFVEGVDYRKDVAFKRNSLGRRISFEKWFLTLDCLKKLVEHRQDSHEDPALKRLMKRCKIDPETGCWLWQGRLNQKGYGMIDINGKAVQVHRLSYKIHFGEIPEGMMVLHRCDVRNCFSPYDLFLGTNQDNMDDMVQKDRQAKGESASCVVLTEAQVLEIKSLVGTMRVAEIARKYGVNHSTVKHIVYGDSWGWLGEDVSKKNTFSGCKPRLTTQQVLEIKEKCKIASVGEIAAEYGIHRATVSKIVNGKTHKNVI